MADFTQAHALVKAFEGGYSNDPLDCGGETIYGISRQAHPHWPGWTMLDAGTHSMAGLQALSETLYHREYWMPLRGWAKMRSCWRAWAAR